MSFFQKIFGSKKIIEKSDRKKRPEKSFKAEDQKPIDEQFVFNFTENGGKFLYCENIEEVKKNFNHILLENNCYKNSILTTSKALLSLFRLPAVIHSKKNTKFEFFLSECEYLISNDGSLLFTSNQLAEKKMNELPRNFIIFAKTSQILETISHGMTKINHNYKNQIPSNITTIKNFKPLEEDHFLSYGSSPKNIYLLLLEDM